MAAARRKRGAEMWRTRFIGGGSVVAVFCQGSIYLAQLRSHSRSCPSYWFREPVLGVELYPDVPNVAVGGIRAPVFVRHPPSVRSSFLPRPIPAVVVLQAGEEQIGVGRTLDIDANPRITPERLAGIK